MLLKILWYEILFYTCKRILWHFDHSKLFKVSDKCHAKNSLGNQNQLKSMMGDVHMERRMQLRVRWLRSLHLLVGQSNARYIPVAEARGVILSLRERPLGRSQMNEPLQFKQSQFKLFHVVKNKGEFYIKLTSERERNGNSAWCELEAKGGIKRKKKGKKRKRRRRRRSLWCRNFRLFPSLERRRSISQGIDVVVVVITVVIVVVLSL